MSAPLRVGLVAATVAIAIALLPARAIAGPWVPGTWHFYTQLRESVMFTDTRYDAHGDRQPIEIVDGNGVKSSSSYREISTDLFAEVGVASRLSFLADFRALSSIAQPILGAGDRSALGISDLWLAMKLLLFDDEIAAAVQVGLTIPTGSATAAEPLGQGDWRTDFTLLVGKLFLKPAVFISGEVGVRLRSFATVADAHAPGATVAVQYSDQVRYALALGYTWFVHRRGLDSLIVSAKLEGVYALQAPVEDGLGILVSSAASFLKVGPELVWTPRRGFQISLGGHYFVAGRALPAFAEIALGIGFAR